MFVMGNALEGLAYILSWALSIYEIVIIARALISWVNPDPWNPIVQFLDRVTEPVLRPIRQILTWRMGIDLSPLVAILAIEFIQRGIVPSLYRIATNMQ